MGDEADHDYALVDVELGYEAAERFYGEWKQRSAIADWSGETTRG